MKKNVPRSLGAALATMLCAIPAYAKQGAPHTLTAEALFSTVDLQWRAPEAPKTLQWHNDYDYNGENFTITDYQKAQVCYAGARFTSADLKEYVGEVVDGITFHQYRDVTKVTGLVYENGEVVAQGVADRSKYAKNVKLKIALDKPVTIKANAEYIFAIKVEGGYNMDYIVMKDKTTDAPGKGDLYSLDGKRWKATGAGDYLVTANLVNDIDEAPASYAIRVDGNIIADAEIASAVNEYSEVTEYTSRLTLPAGEHTVTVEAVYEGTAYPSFERKVTTADFDATAPSPRFIKIEAKEFETYFSWAGALTGGDLLGWNKDLPSFGTEQITAFAGGTSSKGPKIWVRNSFAPTDLTAYGSNAKIKDIKVFLGQGTFTGITLYVMRDNAIVYSQALTADELAAVQPNAWNTFALTTPFALTPAHSYAYGIYVTHAKSEKVVGIANVESANIVSNSYSTTTAKSNFNTSSPSWRTLQQGGTSGIWAMVATLEGATSISPSKGVTIKRDGETIATGVTQGFYNDHVSAPGRYVYSIYPEFEGKTGYPDTRAVKATLPGQYIQPFLGCTYDRQTGEVNLNWNVDRKLAKYNDIVSDGGFEEEMTMMWGAQFTKDELKPYIGYKITSIDIALGDEIGAFKAGVYTAKGKALAEVSLEAGQVQPLTICSPLLETPVEITGEEDLYIAYSGTIPAGKAALLFDNGPAADGGARISLTNGASWMNLGTIAADYANFNIVIGATVTDEEGNTTEMIPIPIETESLGISPVQNPEEAAAIAYTEAYKTPAAKSSSLPRAKSFNLYRNGTILLSTDKTEYTDQVSFNNYDYYVTAVYENGWESAPSTTIRVSRPIEQKGVAPYALKGVPTGSTLNLEWLPGDQAPALTYVQGTKVGGLGLSGTPHVYAKFLAEDLTPYVGKRIDHILFGLYTASGVSNVAIEIAEGENIVYRQEVASVSAGWNDVRLNEPYLIKTGTDLHIGYTLKHGSSVKPLGIDSFEDGTYPSTPGKADIYSTNASAGYWYSLATKKKAKYNWAIKAILANDDEDLQTQDAESVTYSLYHNGTLMRNGITGTSASIEDAPEGDYYVTATNAAGIESGESNKVNFIRQNIESIGTAEADNAAEYFNLQGIRVDAYNLTPGIYLRRTANGKATKVFIK